MNARLLPAFLFAIAATADSTECRRCHEQIYVDYERTPMGRSFAPIGEVEVIERWGETFHHEASDRWYEMFRRGEAFYFRRYRLDRRGRKADVLERRVTHVMGSGERARSYLHRSADGRIVEFPVSWYAQEGRWAMSPGYDRPNHPGFTRQVNHKCMFCHNAYPEVAPARSRPGWDADPRFPVEPPAGIDCARCHGRGAAHARSARPEDIVNPARLPPERSLEVCMQCHYETTTFRLPDSLRRFERSFYSYRPGEPLGDYMVHFDHAPGRGWDDKFEIVGAAYRLRRSACFEGSAGRLTCLSCHNPHARPSEAERADYYRTKCLACHEGAALGPPHAANRSGDCVECHMPLRRAEDVVHVAMTDHAIPRRPPAEPLKPLREKTVDEQTYRGPIVWSYSPNEDSPLYLAVARVKHDADLEAGAAALTAELKRSPEAPAEAWFQAAEAWRRLGCPGRAERYYERTVERDPNHPQALNNWANLLADQGRFDEADALFARAIELDPEASAVHVNRGLALVEAGRAREAAAAFARGVEANSFDAEAHFNLGSARLAAGDLAAALTSLTAALVIEPAHQGARKNLGLLLQTVGREEEAREQFALAEGAATRNER